MKLHYFEFENKKIKLIDINNVNEEENTFTVVIGKNGVGKSRFLANIANSLSEHYYDKDFIDDNHPKVIAVSTSPFDKFPLPKKNNREEGALNSNYRYVGMRSKGPFAGSAVSLISSAAQGLLENIIARNKEDNLSSIFDLLGFEPSFEMAFRTSFIRRPGKNNIYSSGETYLAEFNYFSDMEFNFSNDTLNVLRGLSEVEKNVLGHSLYLLNEFIIDNKPILIKLDIANEGRFRYNNREYIDFELLRAVCILLKYGIVKLMDLRLYKKDIGRMSLRRASSGEQCMLVMMLGIAGNICNESVILIDEPEISLHPKWQEEFMKLVISVFSSYKRCQFIIATHSPQMISNLAVSNCFVVSLTDETLLNASDFYKRSSDFQLAELFSVPGTRNEYLNRECVKALSKLSRIKTLTENEISEFNELLKFIPLLEDTDPVKELMFIIREAMEKKGR